MILNTVTITFQSADFGREELAGFYLEELMKTVNLIQFRFVFILYIEGMKDITSEYSIKLKKYLVKYP